jgi:hypothetical protein
MFSWHPDDEGENQGAKTASQEAAEEANAIPVRHQVIMSSHTSPAQGRGSYLAQAQRAAWRSALRLLENNGTIDKVKDGSSRGP